MSRSNTVLKVCLIDNEGLPRYGETI